MFGRNIEPMNALAGRYNQDKITFILLYTREAHPGSKRPAHADLEDKTKVAKAVAKDVAENRIVLVDDLNGTAHKAWGQMPNSVWVISPEGRILHRMDWNDPSVLEGILSAQVDGLDEAFVPEHTHMDMDGSMMRFIARYLTRWAGLNAIWHMIRESAAMKRQRAAEATVATGSDDRRPQVNTGPCW